MASSSRRACRPDGQSGALGDVSSNDETQAAAAEAPRSGARPRPESGEAPEVAPSAWRRQLDVRRSVTPDEAACALTCAEFTSVKQNISYSRGFW